MPIKIVFATLPLIIFALYWNSISKPRERPKSFSPVIAVSDFAENGVVDRIIQLHLSEDHIAKSETESVKISAQIEMPFDFDGPLEFKWILTENIHLQNDALRSGQLKNIKAQQAQTVTIEVLGFSENENRQVAFQIWGSKNGRKVFADGIITTQKEQTFEHIVQNVERIKAERNK